MKFEAAQENMRFSYFGGGVGVLVSGLIWCAAGSVALVHSNQLSMLALFFGGMFIHPLAMLLSKYFKRPGNHHPKNPLGKLALESTIILFVGLFLAFYVAKLQVEWFYPIMMIFSGMLCILLGANFIIGAFIGGATEIVFSLVIINQSKCLVLNAT
ncbi:MAG: hypothetical protein ACJA0T_002191 [Colwellia sp.]|jgi:hypothetical protein